jgi:hypothetical protein
VQSSLNNRLRKITGAPALQGPNLFARASPPMSDRQILPVVFNKKLCDWGFKRFREQLGLSVFAEVYRRFAVHCEAFFFGGSFFIFIK